MSSPLARHARERTGQKRGTEGRKGGNKDNETRPARNTRKKTLTYKREQTNRGKKLKAASDT